MIVIRNARVRACLRAAIPLTLAALLLAVGATAFLEQQYLLVSFAVAVLALWLFIAAYERRQTGTRRMVIAAVMTALCVAGRLIPFFKPVAALVVLSAIYLGAESGFLVGALAALLSNFTFGQGPWTPFQMLAWGLIGLFAGYLSGPMKKCRPLLLLYGAAAGAAYSMIMDVWSVMWYGGGFSMELYLPALAAALPHTALYCASNFIFLWFLAKPIGDKLERVRVKYGV